MTKSTGMRAAWRPSPCKAEGCTENSEARGYCIRHYHRARRHGDPSAGRPLKGSIPAEMQRIAQSTATECITWPFSYEPTGYGVFNGAAAHREICRLAHGEPPTRKHEAAHSCGNGSKGCVNPNHLRWATHQENMQDMARHGTNNGKFLLNEEVVALMRNERAAGAKIVDIARSRGLSYTVVHRAISGMSWAQGKRDHYKLTKDDVLEIRSLVGCMTQTAIAERFQISNQHVSGIIKRQVWKDVA